LLLQTDKFNKFLNNQCVSSQFFEPKLKHSIMTFDPKEKWLWICPFVIAFMAIFIIVFLPTNFESNLSFL